MTRRDILVATGVGLGVMAGVSDNIGTWTNHCHNAYHQMGGMMRFVKVS